MKGKKIYLSNNYNEILEKKTKFMIEFLLKICYDLK